MNEEIRRALDRGLAADNLRELGRICRQHFDESPAIYGSLIQIFDSLINEYDGQAITVEQSTAISAALLKPIELLLDADSRSPDLVLSRLNALWKGYASLRR